MNGFFYEWLLPLTLSGGVCAALLLLLGALAGRHLEPRALYRASLAALLLFVIPVRLPLAQALAVPRQELVPMPFDAMALAPMVGATQAASPILPGEVLGWLWLFGFAVSLLLAAGPVVSFYRGLRRECRPVTDPEMLAVLRACCAELGLRRTIPMRFCVGIGSPVLIGVARPCILLDETPLSRRELRFVLLHELTHYRNGDLVWRHIALFVRALHWFNPLARLLTARIEAFGELACDAAMTRSMPYEERREYSAAILELIGRSRGCPPCAAGFARGQKTLQTRLAVILEGKRPSRRVMLTGTAGLCVALLLGVTVSALLAPQKGPQVALIGGADGPTAVFVAGSDSDSGDASDALMGALTAGISFDKKQGLVRFAIPAWFPKGWHCDVSLETVAIDGTAKTIRPGSRSLEAFAGNIFYSTLGLDGLTSCRVALTLTDENGVLLATGDRLWRNDLVVTPVSLLEPVEAGWMSLGFTVGLHDGIDYICDIGTEVHAAASGTVTTAKYDTAGFGYHVVLNHGGGIDSLYGHNSELLVKEGTWVERGQVIAKSGRSGNATGPHCHFELRKDGVAVDPLSYWTAETATDAVTAP